MKPRPHTAEELCDLIPRAEPFVAEGIIRPLTKQEQTKEPAAPRGWAGQMPDPEQLWEQGGAHVYRCTYLPTSMSGGCRSASTPRSEGKESTLDATGAKATGFEPSPAAGNPSPPPGPPLMERRGSICRPQLQRARHQSVISSHDSNATAPQ